MLSFRSARAADAALISRIFARSWRGLYREVIDPDYLDRLPEEYWVPSVRSWLESGQFSGLFICINDVPVGCVIYGGGRDEAYAGWGEIVSLYLLPDYAGMGLGSRLLGEALRLLRQDGYKNVYLWAIEGSRAAKGFYARHGFSRTEEAVDYRIGARPVRDVRYVLEAAPLQRSAAKEVP